MKCHFLLKKKMSVKIKLKKLLAVYFWGALERSSILNGMMVGTGCKRL